MEATASTPKVGIIMGSQSDWPTMKEAASLLEVLEISYEKQVEFDLHSN